MCLSCTVCNCSLFLFSTVYLYCVAVLYVCCQVHEHAKIQTIGPLSRTLDPRRSLLQAVADLRLENCRCDAKSKIDGIHTALGKMSSYVGVLVCKAIFVCECVCVYLLFQL